MFNPPMALFTPHTAEEREVDAPKHTINFSLLFFVQPGHIMISKLSSHFSSLCSLTHVYLESIRSIGPDPCAYESLLRLK